MIRRFRAILYAGATAVMYAIRSTRSPKQSTPHSFRNSVQSLVALALLALASCAVPPAAARSEIMPPPESVDDAVTLYYQGDFNASIDMLERVASAKQADPAPLRQLVLLYEEAGDYSQALGALNRLAALEPENGSIDRERFVALCLAGRYHLAEELLPLPKATARSDFYRGLLSMRQNRPSEAAALFRESLSIKSRDPAALYFLGQLLLSKGDYAGAEKSFQTVLRQDADLTIALTPLAESLLAQDRFREAYSLLQRARNMLLDHSEIDSMIVELDKKHPELAREKQQSIAVRQRTALPPRVTPIAETTAHATPIRVGLAGELQSVTIKTGGDFRLTGTVSGDTVTADGKEHELLTARFEPEGISISDGSGNIVLSSEGRITLSYQEPGATTMIFDLLTEKGSFYASTEDRAYRGSISFAPEDAGMTIVNTLPLEAYLCSVLPSEMPASWPEEALKAQAVAARSYTLASMGRFAARGYDVRGSVTSASYRGVTGESPRTTAAVEATRGETLEYDGKPLLAFYSANSGGYTENSSVVWGDSSGMEAVPDIEVTHRSRYLAPAALAEWLASDPRSYSAVSPYYSPSAYRWQKWVPAGEITRRVRREKDIGEVLSVVSHGRGISGRVSAVEIEGTRGSVVVKGDRIRSALGGLRSTLFVSRPMLGPGGKPAYFIFTGGGWGHGVGMDQSGAAGMAAADYAYRQILEHYYPLARLTKNGTDG